MTEIFRTLGDHLAATWDRDPASLPALAAAALAERPAHGTTSLRALTARVLAGDLPAQRDRSMAFGEPPITVYAHADFVVEVNLWVHGTTELHEHGFSGAFQLLHGRSLESRWHFAPGVALDGLEIGALSLVEVAELVPGEVRKISAGPGCIHGLFHLDRPSATVVVRTHGDANAGPQRSFTPPGVAAPSALWASLSDTAVRQLQVVGSLLDAGQAQESFLPLVAQLPAEAAWALVTQVVSPRWMRAGVSLAQMEAGLAPWVEALPAGLRVSAKRLHFHRVAVQLRRVVPAEARRALGLLLACPDRASLERGAAGLGEDAGALVEGFVVACHGVRSGPVDVLGLDDAGSAWVQHRVRGEVEGGVLEHEVVGLSVLAPWFL